MGLFNEDYTMIKEKIGKVSDRFVQCQTKEDFALCYEDYFNLCELYKKMTGEDFFDLSGPIKVIASVVNRDLKNVAAERYFRRFLSNKKRFNELYADCYTKGINAYIDLMSFCASYYAKIREKKFSCEIEGMEIFYSFLNSEFPEQKILFDEMLANNRIFKSSVSSFDCYSFSNFFDGTSYMATSENLDTVSKLSRFAYEFGHVVDFSFLQKISKNQSSFTYSQEYNGELLSCYYQVRFLDYLIKNDIYKEDAKLELSTVMESQLSYLENALLMSFATSSELLELKNENFSKQDFILSLLNRGFDLNMIFNTSFNNLDDRFSFLESLNMANGLIFSVGVSNGEECVKILTSNGENGIDILNCTDITVEKASKQLVKRIESLYI